MSQTVSSRWRTLALVLVGAVVIGLVITPATAHFRSRIGHLFKHIKAKADPLYVNVGEKAANADKLDGVDSTGFLTPGGEIRVNASPLDWVMINPAITTVPPAKPTVGGTTFGGSSGATDNVPVAIAPTLPTMLHGRSVKLVGVNACYDTDAVTLVDVATISITNNANGIGGTTQALSDPTDRGPNEDACRDYLLSAPVTIAPEDDVTFQFTVDYSANAGFFFAGRATFILSMD